MKNKNGILLSNPYEIKSKQIQVNTITYADCIS